MKSRKENLLASIVEEYIKTALPVSSKLIAKAGQFEVSSATIRNDMAELENDGLIFQPHISAGRVPTESGYRYYVKHFLRALDVSPDDKAIFQKNIAAHAQNLVKGVAKGLAELSGIAVLVGFSENNTYYTGLSNMFSQPEFYDTKYVCRMSAIIDHLDEKVLDLYEDISDDLEIYIGRDNPLGSLCSTIVTKYRDNNNAKGLVGLLGPLRMDYQKNVCMLKHAKELIGSRSI